MSSKLIFKVTNGHVVSCGNPPTVDGDKAYCSYYQNIYGEQWIFEGSTKTGTFTLHGGDLGWDNKVQVDTTQDNWMVPILDLVLQENESKWFNAVLLTFLEICLSKGVVVSEALGIKKSRRGRGKLES